MTVVTLANVIETAIDLHDLERGLDRWEIEARVLADAAVTPDPVVLGKACRELALLRIPVDSAFTIHCAGAAQVRTRTTDGLAADMAATVADQAWRSERLGDRLLILRQRLRRLSDTLLHTISALAAETVDARLLRLIPRDERLSFLEIAKMVDADQLAISDADNAWCTAMAPRPRMYVVETTPLVEISAALTRLAADGSLKVRRGMRGVGWMRVA